MKKSIGKYSIGYRALLFLLSLHLMPCLLIPASAQFKAGLLGGIVTSQVDGDTYAGYDKAGLVAGGFVSRKLSEESKWTVQMEITYIQKGSRKIPRPDKGVYTSYKLNLNYAEVPLLVKYDFGMRDTSEGGRMRFSLEAGVAAGALVYSYEEDTYGPLPDGVPFQKTDFSTILGLNYHVSKHITFNIRTQYSVVPVRKGAIAQYQPNWTNNFLKPGYYNNLLTFSFRYQF